METDQIMAEIKVPLELIFTSFPSASTPANCAP